MARKVAAARDEPVVTDLADLGDGRVVYVAQPEAIDERTLLALQRRLDDHGPTSGGFSILTGYTPEQVWDLYARDEPATDDHGIVSWLPGDDRVHDDDCTLLNREEATYDPLAGILDERASSLSLYTTGWSMHLYLNEAILCGYPESTEGARFDGVQPFCVTEDGKDCPFDYDLLYAEDLDVDHVFVASCASMIDNDLTGLPVHVGMGMLGSVESLIGAYKVSGVQIEELYLNYCLVRAGYDVVERCYLLNRFSHATRTKSYPYVPFGRPSAAVETPTETGYEATFRPASEGVAVELADVDAHVVDVTVPRERFPPEVSAFYLQAREHRPDDELAYLAFEEGEDVRLLVFGNGRMEYDELAFLLSDRPATRDRRDRMLAMLEHAERHRNLGVLSKKGQRRTEMLHDRVYSMAEDFTTERYDPTAHHEVAETIDDALYDATNLQDDLVDAYHSAHLPSVVYAERTLENDAYVTDEDADCCGRPLFLKEIRSTTGTERRLMGICPMHGAIFDVPDPGDSSLSCPTITTNRTADGTAHTMTVTFENPADHPAHVAFAPYLPRHMGDLSEVFEPTLVETELSGGQRRTVEFAVDTDDLHPGHYLVNAHVFSNFELYFAATQIIVGDQSGFLPGILREKDDY